MNKHDTITLTIDRSILEHPQALHVRRMRTTIFLYLALLARLPAGADTIEVSVRTLSETLGLHEGTVRSWLGHLKRAGYIGLRRLNGSVVVRFPASVGQPKHEDPAPAQPPDDDNYFNVGRVQRTLGESVDPDGLAAALSRASPHTIQRALAGALAPAAAEIRRSRTALFLFLLKRYGSHEDNSRPGSRAA
jgi:hypothetical protein